MGAKAKETEVASAAEIAENTQEQRNFADVELIGEETARPFEYEKERKTFKYYHATGITRAGLDSVVARRRRQGWEPAPRDDKARMRGISPDGELCVTMRCERKLYDLHQAGRQKAEANKIATIQAMQTSNEKTGLDGQPMRKPPRPSGRKRERRAKGRSMVAVGADLT